MIILLPFLRRFPIRARMLVGAVLLVAGLVLLAASSPPTGGIITAIVGVIFLFSAARDHRRLGAR
jgi:ABC-type Mn2+/Zn2+ transport system permease subunit